jgi:hypothetical protein
MTRQNHYTWTREKLPPIGKRVLGRGAEIKLYDKPWLCSLQLAGRHWDDDPGATRYYYWRIYDNAQLHEMAFEEIQWWCEERR